MKTMQEKREELIRENLSLIKIIQKKISQQPAGVNLAHIGDMNHARKLLKELAEFLGVK